MIDGTIKINTLHYESYLYHTDAVEMKDFLDEKYKETMKLWQDEENI